MKNTKKKIKIKRLKKNLGTKWNEDWILIIVYLRYLLTKLKGIARKIIIKSLCHKKNKKRI